MIAIVSKYVMRRTSGLLNIWLIPGEYPVKFELPSGGYIVEDSGGRLVGVKRGEIKELIEEKR